MIQLSGAGKRYGHKLLFEDADWLITPESHVGLVGANGTGKSTIMKILAGSETLDYGSISRAKGISTGYLPQDGLTMTGRTVFAECMSVFDELHAIEKEMESLTRSMSELDHQSQEYSNVADRYQKLEHEFVARDGYTLEAQVGTVLSGLGFHRDDWKRQTEEFSGGWQMRLALAKLLLQRPNLLLLDEPTNHLDLRAKDVLLEALMKYTGTVVFVSHDRYFIDNLATRVFEIGDGKVEIYPGNYEDYLWRKQGGAARQTETISNELVGELSANRVVTGLSPAPQAPTNGNALKPEPADSKARRLNPIKRQQMEDRLHEIEEEIARAEAAIALCETQLQSFVSAEETQRQTQELARKKSDVQGLMKQWEELSETLESDL